MSGLRPQLSTFLALSRADNKTALCDECVTKEALDAAGLLDGNPVREHILDEMYHRPHRNADTPQEKIGVEFMLEFEKLFVGDQL